MARRTFFSFHYVPDVWRAMNVRNSWVVRPQDADEQAPGFFDGSVFEAKKRESDTALKSFLRDGLQRTSVTCVLAGSDTWSRRWVRYEIARSVVRGNGLLTVDIHTIGNRKGETSVRGADPLAQMGVYRTASGILLAEWKDGKWVRYEDYKLSIPEKDLWFAAPKTTSVIQLSSHCSRYDFVADKGRHSLGTWIEAAARQAGR